MPMRHAWLDSSEEVVILFRLMSGDIRSCAFCGDEFRPARKWQLYCDEGCHDAYYRGLVRLMRDALQGAPLASVASVSLTMMG